MWTIAGLAIGGFLLSDNFRNSVQSDFDERLRFYLDAMIAAAEPNAQGEVSLSGRFADARFERVYSGWYWEIIPLDAKNPGDAQISRSLFDYTIKPKDLHPGGAKVVTDYAQGPDQQRVRFVAQRLEFPITASPAPNDARAYTFLVAGNMSEVEAEVRQFNGTLIWSFALLGVGLIGGIFIQVLIGLQPLRRVSEALARIREGKARRLEGHFPSEIEPLAAELNSLIEHSAEVRRNAHARMSPISRIF